MQALRHGSRPVFDLEELRELLQPSGESGVYTGEIRGIATLREALAGDLSFLGNAKYRADVGKTAASVVLVPSGFKGHPGEQQVFFEVENPSLALARLCGVIEQRCWPHPEPGIHPTAVIDRDSVVAESATIGPLCSVAAGARIGEKVVLSHQVSVGREAVVGEGSWIMPQVVIADFCQIGKRVRLHSGAIIGADGFGYETSDGRHHKVPQIGTVVIEDDVEIGANTTIDRARFHETRIGEGTKIDNQVQVGHNVRIGKHCLIVSQVGISGSVVLEDFVVVGGQSGIVGHITIGKGSQIAAQSGVSKDVAPGSVLRGSPALEIGLASRIMAAQRRLPELFKRFQSLESQHRKPSGSLSSS
jgi:UDP-3-O-[3-hydroxymyristoyl] glucosamine N-acyltransferase